MSPGGSPNRTPSPWHVFRSPLGEPGLASSGKSWSWLSLGLGECVCAGPKHLVPSRAAEADALRTPTWGEGQVGPADRRH